MMTTYGVTPNGFVAKPLDAIKADFEAGFKAIFGPGINLQPQSNFGQFIGIISERLADVWDMGQAVYAAGTPDGASGDQLDDLAAITGSVRNPPALTHVKLNITGTGGTILASGQQVKQSSTGVVFQTVGDYTIPIGGSLSNVEAVALTPGPTTASAGTIDTIVTSVSGWTAVTNPADHYILGALLETDGAFRLRRDAELRSAGTASGGAIRARLLALTGVKQAFVYEDLFNHAIEALVDGGDQQQIADTILATKAAGVGTFGTTPCTAQDNTGAYQSLFFSRRTDVNLYVIVNVAVDGTFPSDGVAQVKQRLLDYAASYEFGDPAVASHLSAEVFNVAGVLDVTSVKIGTSASPTTSVTVTATDHQMIRLDTSRITVNLS